MIAVGTSALKIPPAPHGRYGSEPRVHRQTGGSRSDGTAHYLVYGIARSPRPCCRTRPKPRALRVYPLWRRHRRHTETLDMPKLPPRASHSWPRRKQTRRPRRRRHIAWSVYDASCYQTNPDPSPDAALSGPPAAVPLIGGRLPSLQHATAPRRSFPCHAIVTALPEPPRLTARPFIRLPSLMRQRTRRSVSLRRSLALGPDVHGACSASARPVRAAPPRTRPGGALPARLRTS